MSDKTHAVRIAAPRPISPARSGLGARLRGPGGLYNIGNVLGLASGIMFAVFTASSEKSEAWFRAVMAHLAGNPGNASLTISMMLFIWSGELYHRAYLASQPVSSRLLPRADMISGIASLFLMVSLIHAGNILLAVASTVLLAGGKFGNAFFPETGWPLRIIAGAPGRSAQKTFNLDLFRAAVIASRAPAIISLAAAVYFALFTSGSVSEALQTGVLLLCYLLWLKADLLLSSK